MERWVSHDGMRAGPKKSVSACSLLVSIGEACDEGPDAPPAGSARRTRRATASSTDGNVDYTDAGLGLVRARCADGVVRAGVESCDDGNAVNADGCTNDCAVARCGDGSLEGAAGPLAELAADAGASSVWTGLWREDDCAVRAASRASTGDPQRF